LELPGEDKFSSSSFSSSSSKTIEDDEENEDEEDGVCPLPILQWSVLVRHGRPGCCGRRCGSRRFDCRHHGRGVPDDVINVILQLCSSHLKFFDFLVRREIDFFFDTIDLIVEPMVFIKDAAKMITRAFQTPNHFTMFRKLSQDRMMKVHGDSIFYSVWTDFVCGSNELN